MARLVKILPFERKRLLTKAFVESQFSYCPLIWMLSSRQMNDKINHIQERALRLVYSDYTTSFGDLLIRDESVSIHHRNIQRVAIEMVKATNDLCPEMIKYHFSKRCSSKSKATFESPNINTVYKGEYSLRWFGPIVWDSMIPEKISHFLTLRV